MNKHKQYLHNCFLLTATERIRLNLKNNKYSSIIKDYGCWIEALKSGLIKPTTEEQQNLINNKKSTNEKTNLYIDAWKYYRSIKDGNCIIEEHHYTKQEIDEDFEKFRKALKEKDKTYESQRQCNQLSHYQGGWKNKNAHPLGFLNSHYFKFKLF